MNRCTQIDEEPTITGLLLIVVVPCIELYEANQHNFLNAASCLLAIPAGAWIVGGSDASVRVRLRSRAAALVLVFLPTTVCLTAAFAGTGTLPLQFDKGTLRRTPTDGALDSFYRWASASTPRDAVLICDPRRPVKMSGNVCELPAFTGRAVFVDQLSYMTAPYRDRILRSEIAQQAGSGQPLTGQQLSYLRDLGRPLYVVTFAADEPGLLQGLAAQFGEPVFQQEFVAAFVIAAR